MGRRISFHLDPADRTSLCAIVKRGEDWRERQRAQTLLYLDEGLSIAEVATQVGINPRTVGSSRSAWLQFGFASLKDAVRSGAPKKLPPDVVERLAHRAISAPLSAKALLAEHLQNGGTPVHLNTLMTALKNAGLVWKQTYYAPKGKH